LASGVYVLTGSITYKDRRPPPFDLEFTEIVNGALIGPIVLGIGVYTQRAQGQPQGTGQRGIGWKFPPVDGVGLFLLTSYSTVLYRVVRLNSLSLVRQDSPTVPIPFAFPSEPSTSPEPEPVSDPAFPIFLPGGIPGLVLPTQLPIIIPSPERLGDRPVPVLYDPTIPLATRQRLPQMWLTPEGIQVGTGGQNDPVRITPVDTITNITNITQVNDVRQRIPPPVVVCNAEPPSPADCCDCEEIREIVFEELDKKFPPKRPFTNQTVPIGVAEARTFVLPEFTQWVELTIVTPPPNRRMQSGGVNGQPVYYNGWYSYGITGSTSERKPIHYDFMSIPIPPGIESFTYTIYSGGTANGRIGYRQPTSL